jgi:hypothetical protein
MGADNQSAIADDQAVATTLTLTNDQRTGIVPNRAGPVTDTLLLVTPEPE